MRKHVANYLKFMGFAGQEVVPCEVCGCDAVDVHHIIYRSAGGSDDATNLVGLCRECHELAHEGTFGAGFLENIVGMRK